MQYYSIIMQQDKTTALKVLWEKREVSQAKLANNAGVSQSTVSRRLKKPPQRYSEATDKLCSYAAKELIGQLPPAAKKKAAKKFDKVWSKSNAHATAISKIIDAFAELCLSEDSERRNPNDGS